MRTRRHAAASKVRAVPRWKGNAPVKPLKLSLVVTTVSLLALAGCSTSTPTVPSGPVVTPTQTVTTAAKPNPAGVEGQTLIGLSEASAKSVATGAGFQFQVVERDGHPLPVVDDFRPTSRIDVRVVNGFVTSATTG